MRHDLNISFAHLGHEECEQGAFNPKIFVKNLDENCEVFCDYKTHTTDQTNSGLPKKTLKKLR